MQRNALNELISWKNSKERKPLILKGARQVGKTRLMKEFGKTEYKSFVYFNFDEEDAFKLFVFDTGILKYMARIDNSAILLKSDYQFKGALTENYVLQQLKSRFDVPPRYFATKNSKIDFILQFGAEIIPCEVKGGEDKSAPSFKKYISQAQPQYAIRFSKSAFFCKIFLKALVIFL